ncbi:MAG: hypothetical protein JW819_01255 [Candidatus Krumholzibacteriota bacterium]|nr:hypothetical protein [Candidatus Krumholzibacteriota bacterium]
MRARAIPLAALLAAALSVSHALPHAAGLAAADIPPDPGAVPGPMLVIAATELAPAALDLVAWKNQTGVPTRLVRTAEIGGTAAEIQAYIQAAYDEEGLAYVLLLGDAELLPPLYAGGAPADPDYALVAGGDVYPDLCVGRLPAATAGEMDLMARRIIAYERDPEPSPPWCAHAAGVGGNAALLDAVRDLLLAGPYTEVDRLYAPGATTADVAAALDEGRGLVNYCGHASAAGWQAPAFGLADVAALTNTFRPPCIVDAGAMTGRFDGGTCLAEAWLRAGNDGLPTGAVGVYAPATALAYAEAEATQLHVAELLAAGASDRLGALCFGGACLMLDEYGPAGAETFRHWILFGDPSLRVRTDAPDHIFSKHASFVDPAWDSFWVLTDPGALAALSYKGQLIGAAVADATGTVFVPLDAPLPPEGESVVLTLTAVNGWPDIELITVHCQTDAPAPAAGFALGANHPNPFNPTTRIPFRLAAAGAVDLAVYDVRGRHLRTLVAATLPAGEHAAAWDGRDEAGRALPAGVYLYRLRAQGRAAARRMVLIE